MKKHSFIGWEGGGGGYKNKVKMSSSLQWRTVTHIKLFNGAVQIEQM